MMRLFDSFRRGQPVTAVPVKWFNDIAKWFNNVVGEGEGCEVTITKPDEPSEANPPKIRVRVTARGSSGPELATAVPPAVATSGAVGDSQRAARENHTHAGVQLSDSLPQDIGDTASAGTSQQAARADHVHEGATEEGVELATIPPPPVAADSAVGISGDAARGDHTHEIPLGDPFVMTQFGLDLRTDFTTNQPDANFGYHFNQYTGELTWGFRVHHSIIPAESMVPKPDGMIPGGFVGSSGMWMFANADHIHPANVGSTPPSDVGSAATPGVSNVYARADHVHKGGGAPLATAAPPNVTETGAVGTSENAARQDHTHGGSPQPATAAPKVDATSAAVGTATKFAREDHVHPAGDLITYVTGVQFNATNRTLTYTWERAYVVKAGQSGTQNIDTLVQHS